MDRLDPGIGALLYSRLAKSHPPNTEKRETMASDLSFVEFVADQIRGAGAISFRKMFGEYALYCNGKVVALICDNQLFVKPTSAGRSLLGEPTEAPPYPGAKPHFLIEDEIEDRERIIALIRVTENEMPMPKPKKKRQGTRDKKKASAASKGGVA
jgi:TfoX/Sxy family transcriptional regulator of competence genes